MGPVAVLTSTVIQASYHTYQGSWNLVQVVPTFPLFSIYYVRTRRLFPLIVAHTLMDYLPLLWYAVRHKAH
jgi:membrane protease YdiL (CAAX protease family)